MALINYNINADDGVDDMVVCRALNINGKYAYTPDINPLANDVVEKRNVDAETRSQLAMGVDPFSAKEMAIKIAAKARKKTEKELLAQGKSIKLSKSA